MEELKLVKVKALVAFTEPTPRGMFHGDPNNSNEHVQQPSVPAHLVDRLVDEGKISLDLDAKPLDHDGDGRNGGSRKGAESTRARGAKAKADKPLPPVEEGPFSAKHLSFGKYEIAGPDGFHEEVKGKEAAAARVAELNANAVKTAPSDHDGDGGDAPPVD